MGGVITPMRLMFLVVAGILSAGPAFAQDAKASPAPSTPQDATLPRLPVSVDRIRELLARAPAASVLRGLDRQPDYTITVEERRFLQDIVETLGEKTGPSPSGGLYAYEIQQQVWNTRNSPLVRPYAAFTASELVQVSLASILSGLVTQYLADGGRHWSRTQAEARARDEVRRAIAEYCEARPDRPRIDICTLSALH